MILFYFTIKENKHIWSNDNNNENTNDTLDID